jgi:cytidyltransferase-like protein
MKIVLVTGGFDPLHSGHIAYLRSARELGDKLIVGINSNDWLTRKKGRPFLPWEERATIIGELHCVDRVINFNDDDGTAVDAIRKVKDIFPNHQIIFANGGDRTKDNIPEMVFEDVEFVFGVGGEDKKNSSSWILQEWKEPKTERSWGYWRVLDDHKVYKVKELVVMPGQSLSMQRHFKRSEHWHVLSGTINVETEYLGSKNNVKISTNSSYDIGIEVWHRAYNTGTTPCHILEVQHGSECVEEDIERR